MAGPLGQPRAASSAGASDEREARARDYSSTFRSRRAFVMTETELKLIAALAIIGLRRTPKNG